VTPRDAGDLERILEQVRFEPRASLGPEVLGRHRRGEGPRAAPPRRFRHALLGLLAGVAAMAVWIVATPDPTRQLDRCCEDLDGGGDADDGLLVESRGGATVRRLAIYEDKDRSGNFTPGDPVRYEQAGPARLMREPVRAESARQFCCLDYDGGGKDDDALVVVGVAPDLITMAAIYEVPDTRGSPLRLR